MPPPLNPMRHRQNIKYFKTRTSWCSLSGPPPKLCTEPEPFLACLIRLRLFEFLLRYG